MESICSEDTSTQQESFDTVSNTTESVIPCEQYDAILRVLEDERIAHAQTKAKLMEAEDKLEFAMGEIEVLKKQMQREKLQYEKSFETLKSKALKESYRNSELENKCSVITKTVEERDDTLSEREIQLQQLSVQLQGLRSSYEHQLIDLNVKQQQEAYISRILSSSDRSHRSDPPTSQPVPTTSKSSSTREQHLHQILKDSQQMRKNARQNRLPPRH